MKPSHLSIPVQLWSYFRDLAGTSAIQVELPLGSTLDQLLTEVYRHHPRLGALRNSTLLAVGVEYQGPSYVLQPGDEVSLFPPVQGG
jgi:molybdopterin converting factor small subunit